MNRSVPSPLGPGGCCALADPAARPKTAMVAAATRRHMPTNQHGGRGSAHHPARVKFGEEDQRTSGPSQRSALDVARTPGTAYRAYRSLGAEPCPDRGSEPAHGDPHEAVLAAASPREGGVAAGRGQCAIAARVGERVGAAVGRPSVV